MYVLKSGEAEADLLDLTESLSKEENLSAALFSFPSLCLSMQIIGLY